MHLTLATRKSPLALAQTQYVRTAILTQYPNWTIDLLPLSTLGDEILDRSLQKIGGKGLFTKTLETALLAGQADIAVHSAKDMTSEQREDLILSCILPPASPYDALLASKPLHQLPKGAIVGTSSLRRQAQLLRQRPDLKIQGLRGNIPSRITKWQSGAYDAIVLAEAGLQRLGLMHLVQERFTAETLLPAAGQGIIAIETPAQHTALRQALQTLENSAAAKRLEIERSLVSHLGSNCHTPVAVYAEVHGERLRLRAYVGSVDGKQACEVDIEGALATSDTLVEQAYQSLCKQGAESLIQAAQA